ncbi:MAG: mono(ADP-ribosyl)transferase SpvB, partial [Bacteroidota bacterium]
LTYDVNDTIEESAWKNDPKNASAYAKSKIHADTPSIIFFDSLGRPTLGVDLLTRLETKVGMETPPLGAGGIYTFSEIDIEGNARSVTDARGNVVMAWLYDMLGHRVAQTSMDAGKRWMLNNALGNPVKTWDERAHEFSFEYDILHRPTQKWVKGGDAALPLFHCYEKIIYGESQTNAVANNLRGKAAILYDTAGKITSEKHDFKGNLLSATRIFAKDYKNTPHWAVVSPDTLLETSDKYRFVTKTEYDALNRPIKQITPDGSETTPSFNTAGLLEKVELKKIGEAKKKEYVKNIDYDAKGQRTKIQYGNGVSTKYEYDPLTFRLKGLRSVSSPLGRSGGVGSEEVLQDLSYTYDPTGNITTIQDRARPTVFFNNQKIQGKSEYTYDALYRLVSATGREQNSNSPNFDSGDNWNDAFAQFSHNSGDAMAMRTYTQHFLYDVVGNMLQTKHEAGANGSWTRDNAYETKNNRIKSTTVGNSTYTFDYTVNSSPLGRSGGDKHGFMTAMPHLSSMAWTFKEELQATAKQVVNNGTPETTYYVYDGTGQRVRKITELSSPSGRSGGAIKEERIYVGGFEVYRNQNDLARETLHIMDDKNRIAMIDTETEPRTFLGIVVGRTTPLQTIRYQMGNHLGSVSLELDENAAVISYEEYHPYGTTAYQARNAAIKAAAKRYRYTGMERDEETGLAYHSARYYVPWLGRWASCDPIGVGGGINLYAYCSGDPIGKSDRNGNIAWKEDHVSRDRVLESRMKEPISQKPKASSIYKDSSKSNVALNPKKHKLELGINVSSTSKGKVDLFENPGHTFIILRDENGKITNFFSYGPRSHILSRSTPSTTKYHLLSKDIYNIYEFPLDDKQFEAAKKKIEDITTSPGDYNINHQCTTTALEITESAGLKLPKGKGKTFGTSALGGYDNVTNPYNLDLELKNKMPHKKVKGGIYKNNLFVPVN